MGRFSILFLSRTAPGAQLWFYLHSCLCVSTGVCSWGCPGGPGSLPGRTSCGGSAAAWIAGTLAGPGAQGTWQPTGTGDMALLEILLTSGSSAQVRISVEVVQLLRSWGLCSTKCAGPSAALDVGATAFRSVQFSPSVMSDSLQPHEPRHPRPPCLSPTARIYPNLCQVSRWCHPTVSSPVTPFSSSPQSFPASGAFLMSQLSTSGGQSIGVSASTSVLPMNTQDKSPLGMDWLDLLAVQGTLRSLLQHHSSKASILQCSAFFIVQLSHPYMTTGKTIALTRRTFVGKIMSLLFNMLSRLVITFLPRSKRLLSSWLQLPSEVILEAQK